MASDDIRTYVYLVTVEPENARRLERWLEGACSALATDGGQAWLHSEVDEEVSARLVRALIDELCRPEQLENRSGDPLAEAALYAALAVLESRHAQQCERDDWAPVENHFSEDLAAYGGLAAAG